VQLALPHTTSPVRRHVGRTIPGPRAHADAPENRVVRGPRRRHCALVAVTLAWRPRPVPPCHTAGAHSPAGEPPFPICRRLRRTSPPPRAHAGVPIGHDGEAELPLHAYKTLPFLFPHAPEQPSCPPPPAISAAGDIAAPLAAVLNR
jgi:hypothetical protein